MHTETPCELTIARHHAETVLETRLELGYELINATKNCTELEQLKKDFNEWTSYNSSLLQQIYSCSDYFDNYSAWYGRISRVRVWSVSEEIEVTRLELEYKIDVLETCLEELELLPECYNITPYEFEDFTD